MSSFPQPTTSGPGPRTELAYTRPARQLPAFEDSLGRVLNQANVFYVAEAGDSTLMAGNSVGITKVGGVYAMYISVVDDTTAEFTSVESSEGFGILVTHRPGAIPIVYPLTANDTGDGSTSLDSFDVEVDNTATPVGSPDHFTIAAVTDAWANNGENLIVHNRIADMLKIVVIKLA